MNYSEKAIGVVGLILLIFLSSCEHKVSMKTIVHEDGSLDKTLTLSQGKSNATKNYFNISEQQGWVVSIDSVEKGHSKNDTSKKEKEYKYTFRKTFGSALEANKELAEPNDSLFRVTSKFEKHFRWFYTYYYYSDTYLAINRYQLPIEDYFINSDFQFIERLPAEGKSISKADSLFLNKLNERIYDEYISQAYFDDYFRILIDLAHPSKKQYLKSQKQCVYQLLKRKENFEDDVLITLSDSLGLGIDLSRPEYSIMKKSVENKLNFMSWAASGTYKHVIEMPGDLVSHNADSTSDNELYWSPPHLKFAFKDYTMYAKTRTPNWWAWILSFLILIAAGWSFVRKRD